MTLYIDPQGALHDDMGGSALSLFPTGCVPATQAQIQAITNPPLTLAQAQATQLALMDSSYETANTQPIAYMGTTFQADDYSTSLLAQTVTIATATSTPSVTWWDSTNTGVVMTLAQLVGLGATIFARGQGYFSHKQTQKAAIRAATTVTAVEAIVW